MRKRSPLLHLFHAGGHLRFVFLFQQVIVIRLGLIVAAGQIVPVAARSPVPRSSAPGTRPTFAFKLCDGSLTIRNFDLVGLQLALQLQHRRVL